MGTNYKLHWSPLNYLFLYLELGFMISHLESLIFQEVSNKEVILRTDLSWKVSSQAGFETWRMTLVAEDNIMQNRWR